MLKKSLVKIGIYVGFIDAKNQVGSMHNWYFSYSN